ncbi:MAG: hypothetical protein ACPGJV_05450 [Bacteriovoracaceae bacterium]
MRILLLFIAFISISCSHHSYKRYDVDGDGKVTKTEWTEKHDKKFAKLDKNSDGVLSGDELGKKKHCKKKKCCKKKSKDCKGDKCSLSKKDCSKCGSCKNDCGAKCQGDKCPMKKKSCCKSKDKKKDCHHKKKS